MFQILLGMQFGRLHVVAYHSNPKRNHMKPARCFSSRIWNVPLAVLSAQRSYLHVCTKARTV
jgi:hypothetical protein